MKVLQSKLQPPKRPGILHRQRLARLFETLDHKKAVTVVAGAGFGKTTLVIDALSCLDMRPLWYRLDRQDLDFHVFISYLYAMVDLSCGPADRPGEPFCQPSPGLKSRTDILMEWLVFLQERCLGPGAIILDDYHLVQENPQINQGIDFILQRLPAHIHLVIIGRTNLPLTLSRLRAQDQLLEINEQELAFSSGEIQLFFQKQPTMTFTDFDAVFEMTKGWAASLVLLRYAFEKDAQKGIPAHLRQLRKRPEYIFSYLKENIFDAQPEPVRHFMMKAALLPEIDVQLCARIFKVKDAHLILNQMLEDHLLIFPVDDSARVFYLHHLFRDFLLEQLHKTYPPSAIFDLHCRIGKIVASHDVCQSLHHFIEGQDFDRAIGLIKTHEMKFLLEGKIHFLGEEIKKIPQNHIKAHPRLLMVLSRLYSHYGDPEKAMQLISRALKLYKRQNAKEDMISCVIELGSQYYYSGHLKEAKLLMEQVLDDIDPKSQTYIMAMTFLTFLPAVVGEFEAAGKYDKRAREVIAGYSEFERDIATALLNTSLSHTLCFAGDFEASQQVCKILLKEVLKLNIEPCLPLVYYQLSANSFYLGEYERGCTYAREGIAACEKMALADSRKGWVYLAWAQNSLALGNFDEALEKIHTCTLLFEQPGNRWGLASTWNCLAAVQGARHRTALAKKTLEKALELIKGYGLKVTRGILENSYAKVLLDENNPSAGLEKLFAVRPCLKGAFYHLFDNYLMAAQACFNLERLPEACRQMAKAVDLSMMYGYDHFMAKEKIWILPLLHRALEMPHDFSPQARSYFETLFSGEWPRMPAVLKIYLLGKFTLEMGDKKILLSDWKSTKSLMILKYLAAHRCRGYIHREKLIELLWPDQDPQKTAARFNMAMSTLRKTLEPEISPKAPSAYIDRRKDTYRLFDDGRICIDSENFSSLLLKAAKSRDGDGASLSSCLNAIALYRGDFLEEDPYEEWCTEKREALLRDYMAALQLAIRFFEEKKDWDQAVIYAEKLLEKDPLDETAVEKLMGFYAETGAVSKVKNTYTRYARAACRLSLPVSEKLKTRHHDLVKT